MNRGEQIIRNHLSQRRRSLKQLWDDNRRLRESRQLWKQKHASRQSEIQSLRRRVKRLEGRLARRAPERPAPWKNIHLSERDLERILTMEPRD